MDPVLNVYEFGFYPWAVLILCAFLTGLSKTAVPGLGILVVPIVATVMPAQASTGLLLGLLILADFFAAGWYRRHAEWGHLAKLLPWALAGIVIGYVLMRITGDAHQRIAIGLMVLAMLGLSIRRKRRSPESEALPQHPAFAAVMGALAGITTMMANAAGPVMTIYLLAAGLPKIGFVGTAAWFFLVVNWLKVPFQLNLGNMNMDSIRINLMLLPAICVGAVTGIAFLKRIPQKAFSIIVQILAATAALKLILG